MTQSVYVALPTYHARPDVATLASLVDDIATLKTAGTSVKLRPIAGGSIIAMTRNFFVADFLASDCTDLVMIDDDISWEEGALPRLLSHPCDVVAGVYPKRQDTLEFPIRRIPGARVDFDTGLLEVELVPTGFLRMTRACLEQMVAAYPHLAYRDRNNADRIFHALFWIELAKGLDSPDGMLEPWGEDFTFCKRWRDLGGQVFLDTLLRFQHIGRKAYTGCYAESMPVAAMFEKAA